MKSDVVVGVCLIVDRDLMKHNNSVVRSDHEGFFSFGGMGGGVGGWRGGEENVWCFKRKKYFRVVRTACFDEQEEKGV